MRRAKIAKKYYVLLSRNVLCYPGVINMTIEPKIWAKVNFDSLQSYFLKDYFCKNRIQFRFDIETEMECIKQYSDRK